MAALLSNAYLDDQSSKIRSKVVPWEGYQRAGHITSDELALIRKVDRQPRSKTDSIFLTDGPTYALLYLGLLKKLARVDTMQYILVLIGDALSERVRFFLKASESDSELPYGPLVHALDTSDEFVQLKTAQILTIFLSASPTINPSILKPFLQFLSTTLQGSPVNQKKRDVTVQSLEALLPQPAVRYAVWNNPALIQGLVAILKDKPSPQLSYQAVFCFWLLTFEKDIAEQINSKYDIIPVLTEIAQEAAKEKVIRVVIATFRNLVSKAPSQNLPSMLVAKLLPFIRSLSSRKFSDEEIVDDITYLKTELSENFESLTTYDEYTSELASGHLSWSPVHESDTFWKENAAKLNDRDYEQLKSLIKLLNESTDPLVLAVAAHDVGQYVKYYERGKKVVSDLGAKTRVMELMGHSSSDVRYQALISVQRLISNPWVTV
ncbi:ATPase, V1 complex, subunit H [Sistotremastrum niveocremeum HHB9708]|uniref:V-type proton ATPase subunit H n=1 Tax=Sistotremastrum niveocremeum HHB9708 TaxID=1314777 RepID=A0A165AI06_9AGAM|nr:ATPase, V1 complex, subunit H [Sistotremastrum niveocremeum HHB9708]